MGKIWILNNKCVCMATHPQMPNHSGHARGRKIHLAKEDKEYRDLTVCNMLVDEYIHDGDIGFGTGKCKICFRGEQ